MRDPDVQEMATSVTALGHVGQPEDIGGGVASPLSPEMGWVNLEARTSRTARLGPLSAARGSSTGTGAPRRARRGFGGSSP